HKFIGYAHGVICVLEENRAVGVAIDAGIVALRDEHVGFALFFHFAFDEFHDVRVIDVEDHHLGRATRLAAALDHARKGVETLHKAHRTGGNAAARERFFTTTQSRKIRARAGAPFEEHAFGA